LVGGALRSAGTLAERGILAETEPGTPPSEFTYDADGSASVRFKVAGASAPGFSFLTDVDAGAAIEFARGATAFVAFRGLTQTRLSNAMSLGDKLVRRYWNGQWNENTLAVTDVVSAARGTVLAAARAGALAEVRLSGAVGGSELRLADLAMDASVMYSR